MHAHKKTSLHSRLYNRGIPYLGSLVLLCFISFKSFTQLKRYETKIYIDDKHRKITEEKFLYQINRKEDNWISQVEIDHSPSDKLEIISGTIISKGRVVRKLKKKDILIRNDLSHGSFYQDDLIAEFDLFWDDYPYQIEYSYKIIDKEFLFIASWYPFYFFSVPTESASLTVDVPEFLKIFIKINQADSLEGKEIIRSGRRKYTWSIENYKVPSNEHMSIPLGEYVPYINIVPENFSYGIAGNSSSWELFGKWEHDLNLGSTELPYSEKVKVDRLIAGSNDQKDITRKIYHYLQDETKYLNVGIDIGGLKSYPASYVVENKYGDCKALTTYMKAMLSHVGIKSVYTIVNAGSSEERIDPNFPSQQFNHVILYVPMGNDTIWLENTGNYLPFNYLGTFTQDRYALGTDPEQSQLVRTPKMKLKDVAELKNYHFQKLNEGSCELNAGLKIRGEVFSNFRYCLKNKEDKEKADQLEDIVGIKGFDLKDWNLMGFHRDSTFLEISVNGTIKKLINKLGRYRLISPLIISIDDFEAKEDRILPLRFPYPINKRNTLRFDLDGIEKEEIKLPSPVELKTDFGIYTTDFNYAQDQIEVKETFIIYAGDISSEDYQEFYQFIAEIKNYKKKSPILIL